MGSIGIPGSKLLSIFKPPTATTPPDVSEQYTPPNWSGTKALYAITFQSQGTLTATEEVIPGVPNFKSDSPSTSPGFNQTTNMNMFVFDAINRAQHRQTANVTQHPLQTGFNISDHVIKQPVTLALEVGMSDAIASYTLAGYTPMWTQNKSKSVSAYQQMVALMDNRQLMDINTRLQTYFNMVLIDIAVEDSRRTYFGGLAMLLSFQQVIIADVAESFESARIQTSGETTQGTVQPQPPSPTVVEQHSVSNFIKNQTVVTAPGGIPTINIPGAGNWTSNIVSGTKDWFKMMESF